MGHFNLFITTKPNCTLAQGVPNHQNFILAYKISYCTRPGPVLASSIIDR